MIAGIPVVVVTGSRELEGIGRVARAAMIELLTKRCQRGRCIIASGNARGPDRWALDFASSRKIPSLKLDADWERLGKGAGMIRNGELIAIGDEVVALWWEGSSGTRDTIEKAAKHGLPVDIIRVERDGSGVILERIEGRRHIETRTQQ